MLTFVYVHGTYIPYIIAVCKCLQTFTNDCRIRVVNFQYSKYTTKANQSNVSSFIRISRVHFMVLVFSGTSVNGRPRISKVGNRKLRNLLFKRSFTACNCNAACKALYDRIVAKGSSKKLALLEVCNKLP